MIDPRQTYQRIDGFGYALTGGSAEHLMKMSAEARKAVLQELFDPQKGIGVSCVRLTLGASDLNSFVFSYDDLPAGKEDFKLSRFSLAQDLNDVVPVMREILAINPHIQVLSSPWSAPAWMKTNADVRGGQLRKECYGVYADYFVRYVEAMRDCGIDIDAVTVQNEPLNSRIPPVCTGLLTNRPISSRTTSDRNFVKQAFRPESSFSITTATVRTMHWQYTTILMRHNIFWEPAFHHYRGDLSAMSYVHEARPDKEVYFTEQMTTERPGTAADRYCCGRRPSHHRHYPQLEP